MILKANIIIGLADHPIYLLQFSVNMLILREINLFFDQFLQWMKGREKMRKREVNIGREDTSQKERNRKKESTERRTKNITKYKTRFSPPWSEPRGSIQVLKRSYLFQDFSWWLHPQEGQRLEDKGRNVNKLQRDAPSDNITAESWQTAAEKGRRRGGEANQQVWSNETSLQPLGGAAGLFAPLKDFLWKLEETECEDTERWNGGGRAPSMQETEAPKGVQKRLEDNLTRGPSENRTFNI